MHSWALKPSSWPGKGGDGSRDTAGARFDGFLFEGLVYVCQTLATRAFSFFLASSFCSSQSTLQSSKELSLAEEVHRLQCDNACLQKEVKALPDSYVHFPTS